jgi:hypothetical protein
MLARERDYPASRAALSSQQHVDAAVRHASVTPILLTILGGTAVAGRDQRAAPRRCTCLLHLLFPESFTAGVDGLRPGHPSMHIRSSPNDHPEEGNACSVRIPGCFGHGDGFHRFAHPGSCAFATSLTACRFQSVSNSTAPPKSRFQCRFKLTGFQRWRKPPEHRLSQDRIRWSMASRGRC